MTAQAAGVVMLRAPTVLREPRALAPAAAAAAAKGGSGHGSSGSAATATGGTQAGRGSSQEHLNASAAIQVGGPVALLTVRPTPVT